MDITPLGANVLVIGMFAPIFLHYVSILTITQRFDRVFLVKYVHYFCYGYVFFV